MRLLIIGDDQRAERLVQELESEEISLERPSPALVSAGQVDEIGELAAAMRGFEEGLIADAPDALLLASATDLALAALLVATKLGIPVAGVDGADAGDSRDALLNRRLIEQLADTTLAADPEAIAAWLRAT
jgi:UDP-N-acetylglucosamine 2-epimerase